MMTKFTPGIYFTRVLLISYFSWFAMGSRANTIAHATRTRSLKGDENHAVRMEIAKSISAGVKMALVECQSQFRWDRWNCPDSSFATRYESLPTREMAYVSAMTSAGIAHSVTKSCSRGAIGLCGCVKDSPPKDLQERMDEEENSLQTDWHWRGCSDDISMGEKVAQTFLASLDGDSADVLSKVNTHNSQLGLAVVRESVKPDCKCHGVSGSCTTKTCWRKLEPLHRVADILKHRYSRAVRIQVNMNKPRFTTGVPKSLMVFADESPDYCKPNPETGWPGTGGRLCSRGRVNITEKGERRSCRELCRSCGHQVKRRRVKTSWHCNCTFHWCCQVDCSTCEKTSYQWYCDDTPQRYF